MYFEKTENKKTLLGMELTQIRYLKDLPQFDTKAGQLGGWVSEKAILEQNGKWFLGIDVNVLGGIFKGGNFKGGNFEGGIFKGGNFKGGNFEGGIFEGGIFKGGIFEGGIFKGGIFKGGIFKGGNFEGGIFEDGIFKGGNFEGGIFKGGNFKGGIFKGGIFSSNFQNVPFLNGGKYPLNFSGYTENGERLFACGCQVFPESKWTPKFRKKLAKEYNFTESELKISNKMFSLLKELTPKKEM